MKRLCIILTAAIVLCATASAEVNMPSGPVYDMPSATYNSASQNYKKENFQTKPDNATPLQPISAPIAEVDNTKATLDSLARSALKAAEEHNNEALNKYVRKMMENGAEGFSNPQIIAKKTPHCPPIRIKVNGKELSGSKCSLMGYLYKGKQYDVGYCK